MPKASGGRPGSGQKVRRVLQAPEYSLCCGASPAVGVTPSRLVLRFHGGEN